MGTQYPRHGRRQRPGPAPTSKEDAVKSLLHLELPRDASCAGALIAAIGTAEAALSLVRDGGRLCSLTSEAPAEKWGITSTNLYVRPDAAQLARLVKQVSEGTLQLMPEVHPLREAPAAFTRVATGRVGGNKLLLIP
jgi:hypothetical protein